MSKFFKLLLPSFILFLMLAFIFKSDKYIPYSKEGLLLYATTVLPSLLPFFFLTAIMTGLGSLNAIFKKLNKPSKFLFRQSGACFYAFTMSALSGYPVGSRIVYDLKTKGLIGEDEATRMSTMSSTSGPLFIVGAVGVGMFNDKFYGFIMLISHLLSALLSGLAFRFYGKDDLSTKTLKFNSNSDNLIYESIYSSVISVMCVGGFVAIFYVFSEIAFDCKLLYPLQKLLELIFKEENIAKAITMGIIECTKGCSMLSQIEKSALTASCAVALISLGGLSVSAQSITYLSRAKVNLKIFLLSKLLQTVTSFSICYLLLSL